MSAALSSAAVCRPAISSLVHSRRQPAVFSRRHLATRAVFSEESRISAPNQGTERSARVLPLMSDYVLASASLTRFEELAGRSAMIGFGVAAAVELSLPTSSGVFGAWAADGSLPSQFACVSLFLLCCSVALAARTQRPLTRHRLLEPVIASLTGRSRSLAGVSNRNVDRAVDYVLESVFTSPFIRANFPDDEDKYI